MVRLTLLIALSVALYLGPEAGGVSAKECLMDVTYVPDPPIAAQETIVTFSSLNLASESRDPDCAFGATVGQEPVVTLGVAGPGSGFSADLERLNAWQYRAGVTFPIEGSWELSFGRTYRRSETKLLDEQNRFSVDVVSSAALPSAGGGFGDGGAGVQAELLAYSLAALGGAALVVGALLRLSRRRV
ncbi:MAG: hypothetical protein IIC73_03265 [Armatimonadetes bacterium]|nr:hypothetical protein [Armatimonadota bacterium]